MPPTTARDEEALLHGESDVQTPTMSRLHPGEVRTCYMPVRPWWRAPLVVYSFCMAAALVALGVALARRVTSGAAGAAMGRIVGLEEQAKTPGTHLFAQALRALEDTSEPKPTTTPKPAPPKPKVFEVTYPWHKHDAKKAVVQNQLRRPSYKGKEGLWCVGVTAIGYSLDPDGGRGGNFSAPGLDTIQYFHHMGANCFRIAITWERLQSKLGSKELDPVFGLEQTISFITSGLGDRVILDPHNSERGLQHNGLNVLRSDFVQLWKAIANKWGHNDKVIFGLYNEPRYGYENGKERFFNPDSLDHSGEMIEFWRQWAQGAIDAIRKTGAKNLILVPGLRRTTCAEWGGAGRWGEALDGEEHAGNTRLAALHDPEAHLAYDVHQHLDEDFSGKQTGCSGHDSSSICQGKASCHGADWGLQQTIAWAKKYQKKLMMTEISSLPSGHSSKRCQQRLHHFIKQMKDSGVFLGYQVSQFGCQSCPGDLWSKRPLNMDWYRLHDFGHPCSADGADCRSTKCCSSSGSKCYDKNGHWASCKAKCIPGIDPKEKKAYRTNWTCNELTYSAPRCSGPGEDCSQTMCCSEPGMKCYVKEKGWAMCRRQCVPGQIRWKDAPEHQTPWNCSLLGALPDLQLK